LLGELAGVGMSLDAWFRSERREFDLLKIKSAAAYCFQFHSPTSAAMLLACWFKLRWS
jgi:hypothetical protein